MLLNLVFRSDLALFICGKAYPAPLAAHFPFSLVPEIRSPPLQNRL
jgi:hypothetical protein